MRLPVSAQQNNWFNSQNVDDSNLKLEQNYNNQIQASTIDNHFGSGVLLESLIPNIVFDSSIVVGLEDGKGFNVQSQPSDSNLGNQLSVSLSGSTASGNRGVKVFIIGLDFQNTLQYDTLTFYKNEIQITKKHYTKVLQLFFNDLVGATNKSLNLGGKVIITDAKPFTLSRDSIMVSQDLEPNLFLRDFYFAGGVSLSSALTTALPSFNIDSLNITDGYLQLRSLLENDISSQIGQKFQAVTNNIQKITLAMAVNNTTTPSDLVWTGDIIVSIYPLQSSIACQTDVVPSLAIAFPPSNIPVAQLTFNYNSLLASGIQLNTVPQPVDFIFSNTPVGAGTAISPGTYYIVTVKRAGTANKCEIQLAVGGSRLTNSNEALFDGNNWIDVTEEDLWFKVWTDAAKVSDGQAYDGGYGIYIPKTITDPNTGSTIDNLFGEIQFALNETYYALVQANLQQTDPVQDERTGNPIDTKQQFVPGVSLITSTQLINLEKTSSPLLIGSVEDQNVKSFSQNSPSIITPLLEYTIVKNQLLVKIIDNPSDVRYNLNVLSLVTEFLNGSLNNAQFIPNPANPSVFYRISDAELITMIYGDTNGDGIVDENDLLLAQNLIGSNLNKTPASLTQYDGYINYFADDILIPFTIIDLTTMLPVASGTDGYISTGINQTQALFTSASIDFSLITNLGSKAIVVNTSANLGNVGTFPIIGYVDTHDVNIKKTFYDINTMLQILRTDVNGDMIIDGYDMTYINNYVYKVQPFPATTSPANLVGKKFNTIKLTLEKFVDRNDDYNISLSTRSSVLHTLPDIMTDAYTSGHSLFGINLLSSPLQLTTNKQLSWEDYFISVNANQKFVSTSFGVSSNADQSCTTVGVVEETLPLPLAFDSGKNDFFIPNNLVMNLGGNIVNPDGYFYKVDMEVSNIILELPSLALVTEKTINIFTDFVADFNNDGTTRLGYQALRFSDCSFVDMDALNNNRVRFSVSIQSLSPELDGYACNGLNGVIVDNRMGIYIDQNTGLLYFNFANLYDDAVLQALSPKIQVTVFLKKAGWNNKPLFVSYNKMQNILGLTPTTITCGLDTLVLLS